VRNLRLLPLSLFALALLPTSLFLWGASSTLKKHIQPAVVNDPQAGLSQSLKVIKGAVEQWGDKIRSNALRFSENENLKKYLSSPIPSLGAFRVFGKKFAETAPLPLIILTDKKGNILYDNLNLPKPTPTPAPSKKGFKPKPAGPLLASARDFPGMDRALVGTALNGFFIFQGLLYNGSLAPILNKGKTLGVIILGALAQDDFILWLKSETPDDLALYSRAQTLYSRPHPPAGVDFEKMLETADAKGYAQDSRPLDWNRQSYLMGGLTLPGLDSKPLALIAAFQPIKKTLSVDGNPEKIIRKQGWWFLCLGFLLALGASWFWVKPLNQLLLAMDQVKNGRFDVELPLHRRDEWGILSRSLREMITGLMEKDRVSLILGKVVSPKAAKNILESGDFFALKGERREVTILHADLRGFNALSENMPPQDLVESLNQYFTLINEIVFKYEGLMDKFIGETAIALWGAPFTHEDKELRAARAAMEIQESLKDFNISRIKKGRPPFTIAIGIHTGWVVSGNLGSDKRYDYTVIGDPLHIAARLCAMAAPGQTVASEETYQKLKPQVEGKALNPIAVKGSQEPLKTFEITDLP